MTKKRRTMKTKAAATREQVYAFAWGAIERGHPLELTVEGSKAPALAGSVPLARRALARLGVKEVDLG